MPETKKERYPLAHKFLEENQITLRESGYSSWKQLEDKLRDDGDLDIKIPLNEYNPKYD